MKSLRNAVCILAACVGLPAMAAARGEGPGSGGTYGGQAHKGGTLPDSAWQQRREGTNGHRMVFGISRADPEVFPGNLGEQRGDERGASRANRERGGWYQPGRDQGTAAPLIDSPLTP